MRELDCYSTQLTNNCITPIPTGYKCGPLSLQDNYKSDASEML